MKYSGRGVTAVEERELWHMPILLLALLAVTLRGVGTPASLEACVSGRDAASSSRVPCCARRRVAAQAQTTHLLIIVGLAGDPEHGELFRKWGTTLAETASSRLGVPKSNIVYLTDEEKPQGMATGRSTREEIVKAFGVLASGAGDDDTVMIVLFGHGTFDGKLAKFNVPGPDMSPADFAPLLARLRSKHVVFVNTASASGPFVEALSGPGRVVLAATRTGAEKFATLFGGPFVDAFATEAADTDRNGRVSVLEAFEYARKQVAAEYQRNGLLQTEHAILDDNGDKEGSMESGRAGEGRAGCRGPEPRVDPCRGGAGHRTAARAVCRAPGAGAADRVVEAAEERDGPGEVRSRAGKAGHRAGAKGTADSGRGRKEQMRSAAAF